MSTYPLHVSMKIERKLATRINIATCRELHILGSVSTSSFQLSHSTFGYPISSPRRAAPCLSVNVRLFEKNVR